MDSMPAWFFVPVALLLWGAFLYQIRYVFTREFWVSDDPEYARIDEELKEQEREHAHR